MADYFQFQMFFLFTSLYGILYVVPVKGSVVELDDSFRELKKDGIWFVEFYAPWCGHCKKLEPIWEEVAVELMSSIVTAKLDCTKFRDLAEEMDIHGFPTIRFFRGGNSITYRGPRTKDALVEFARKASRPVLTEFKTTEEFDERRTKTGVFFVFVKDEENTSEEYKGIVREVAESKVAQAAFYSVKTTILPKDIKLDKVPNLLVFKDNTFLPYEAEDETLNKTALAKWVDREKFPSFLFVSESNVEELADTGKMIVFVTFGGSGDKKGLNKRLGEIVKKLSVEMNDKFGRHFQFAGLLDTEITESIMMSTAEVPFILVLEPKSRSYYMLPSSAISESFGLNNLSTFLESIIDGKATVYGGRTFTQRMLRIWWDVRSSAKDIWNASPLMAIMIFGLPVLVITFLIVMLCCLEPASENDELEDELDERIEQSEETNITDLPVSDAKPARLKSE